MAKQIKTAKTLAELSYEKELKRIKQFISRASKRGYVWGDNVIPQRPKKITQKSVERLKKITPKLLYEKGEYIQTETGELLPGRLGRNIERKRSQQKAIETRKNAVKIPKYKDKKKGKKDDKKPEQTKEPKTDKQPSKEPQYPQKSNLVLGTIRYMINQWMPAGRWSVNFREKKYRDKLALESILDRAIANEGEGIVAQRLEETGASVIAHIVDAILYDSDSDNVKYSLNQFAEILNGSPLDAIESAEIADIMEQYENWESPQ